jgi:hypothetical protein
MGGVGMTRSLALRNIYVEGDDDVAILSRWFPPLQFRKAGGQKETDTHPPETGQAPLRLEVAQ